MLLNNASVLGKHKNLRIENRKIAEISDLPFENAIDLKGKRVIPGLIDVHTHGCVGRDTMDADFEAMCDFYAKNGTTSWLPTTLTADEEKILRVTTAKTDFKGANILGFHMEGPYINKKYKGAQNESYIRKPNIEEFSKYNNIKMISLAPEIEGSEKFIKQASKKCIVSLGHTDCDYETAKKAIECGANCLTHTYNAMPPIHHRNPGPIGAGVEKRIYAQLITDGVHIAKPIVLATYKMFGADRMIIISDSIRCAGLPDGEYDSGGLRVFKRGNEARLVDGTIAGGNSTLWHCVKKAYDMGIPFDDAVKMASETPAEMLGVKKGKIEVGYDADLLVIDDKLNIEQVIIGGEIYK